MLPLIAQRDLQHRATVLLEQNLALQQLAQALPADQLVLVLACCDYLKLVALQVAQALQVQVAQLEPPVLVLKQLVAAKPTLH
jgi:hypothetical protein